MAPSGAASDKTYPSHHLFFDYLVISAALGTVGGMVVGECHGTGFQANYVAGHAILGSLLGLFAGVSWGGEDPGPSTHPPKPVGSLSQLENRTSRGDHVEVWTDDGAVVRGKLRRVREGSVELKTDEGDRSIPDYSILRVATGRDPSWDGALLGAATGATSAAIWFETTTVRSGASASETEMILLGAAILGATGLVSDMFHNGRSVVLERAVSATSRSFGVVPRLAPDGGALAVTLRF